MLQKLIRPDRRLTPRQTSMVRYTGQDWRRTPCWSHCSDADAPRFAAELLAPATAPPPRSDPDAAFALLDTAVVHSRRTSARIGADDRRDPGGASRPIWWLRRGGAAPAGRGAAAVSASCSPPCRRPLLHPPRHCRGDPESPDLRRLHAAAVPAGPGGYGPWGWRMTAAQEPAAGRPAGRWSAAVFLDNLQNRHPLGPQGHRRGIPARSHPAQRQRAVSCMHVAAHSLQPHQGQRERGGPPHGGRRPAVHRPGC
jgi:hypothetical protein